MYHRKGGEGTLYMLSMMLRRKHCKAKRGCYTFALVLGAKHKFIENFKHIMLKYLNVIFDLTNNEKLSSEDEQGIIQKVVKELYELLN